MTFENIKLNIWSISSLITAQESHFLFLNLASTFQFYIEKICNLFSRLIGVISFKCVSAKVRTSFFVVIIARNIFSFIKYKADTFTDFTKVGFPLGELIQAILLFDQLFKQFDWLAPISGT